VVGRLHTVVAAPIRSADRRSVRKGPTPRELARRSGPDRRDATP